MIDDQLQNPAYAFGAAIGAAVKNMRERLEALERENEELKTRLENFKDCGTWKEGETYYEMNLLTDKSAYWICRCTTQNRPGSDPVSWRLVAKGYGEPLREEKRKPSHRNGPQPP